MHDAALGAVQKEGRWYIYNDHAGRFYKAGWYVHPALLHR